MPSIDDLCVNTIRTLAMDAVQQANSGHPGTPMSLASARDQLSPRTAAAWSRPLVASRPPAWRLPGRP